MPLEPPSFVDMDIPLELGARKITPILFERPPAKGVMKSVNGAHALEQGICAPYLVDQLLGCHTDTYPGYRGRRLVAPRKSTSVVVVRSGEEVEDIPCPGQGLCTAL